MRLACRRSCCHGRLLGRSGHALFQPGSSLPCRGSLGRPDDPGFAARIVARMGRWVSNLRERRDGVRHARRRPTAPRTGETVPHRVRVSRHRDGVRLPGPSRFSPVHDDRDSREETSKHNVMSPSRGSRLTLMPGCAAGTVTGAFVPGRRLDGLQAGEGRDVVAHRGPVGNKGGGLSLS